MSHSSQSEIIFSSVNNHPLHSACRTEDKLVCLSPTRSQSDTEIPQLEAWSSAGEGRQWGPFVPHSAGGSSSCCKVLSSSREVLDEDNAWEVSMYKVMDWTFNLVTPGVKKKAQLIMNAHYKQDKCVQLVEGGDSHSASHSHLEKPGHFVQLGWQSTSVSRQSHPHNKQTLMWARDHTSQPTITTK